MGFRTCMETQPRARCRYVMWNIGIRILMHNLFQGFLLQFSMSCSICMDMAVSLCFLLIVKCGWGEQNFRKVEAGFHIMLWPLTLGPAIYLWANQSFFPTVLACWISMCADDPQCQMEHGVAILFRRLFQVMCLLHFLFSAYVMSQVYSVAMRSSQHHIVARRGLCYAATIAVVQLPPIVVQCASFLFQLESPAAIAFSFTAVPLCGFLNLLVFMMQRRTMRTAYGRLWRRILDVVSCSRPPPEAPPVRLDSRDLFQTTVVEAPPKRLSKVLDEVDVHADDDDN